MKRPEVAESPNGKWTRPEAYLGAMARKRSFRKARRTERTQPETPRLFLSTVPFFALIALLGVLAVAIMIAAFPGTQPLVKAPRPVPREQGVAQKGWLQEAQKDFHR